MTSVRATAENLCDFTVDCDSHVLEPADLWVRYIDPAYRKRAIRIEVVDGVETLLADGQTVMQGTLAGLGGAHLDRRRLLDGTLRYADGCPPGSYDAGARLRLFDDWGLHAGLVFPTIGILPLPTEDDGLLNAYAGAYNRWLTDFRDDTGGRALAVAQLNLRDIGGAVEELGRCIDRGFKAVFVPPELVGGRRLSDPHFDPVWTRCAEAGLPICLHVVVRTGGAGRPFAPWLDGGAGLMFGFTLGAPGQIIPALTDLILGGTFDRVPGLKVLAVEAGAGWAPFLMDRLHEKHDTLGPLVQQPLRLAPPEYIQRNCWFVAEPEERTIGSCLDLVGEDRILWGSDYPHIDSTMEAPDLIRRTVEALGPERRRAVLGGSARTLFSL